MKKNIALVTGGFSGEAVISYKSAITIQNNMDPEKWICYLIDITSTGWFYCKPNGDKVSVDKNDFSITVDGDKILFDAVLIGLHGSPGEDGKLQGYFDCLNIRYTSCNAASSALTFNKRYTLAVAAFGGIKVAKSIHLFKNSSIVVNEILSTLTLPVFVKPNNGGSSIGMSKVNIERFQKDETRIMLITLQSGAASISLHDLNGNYPRYTLINPSFSAVNILKALGRCHRVNGKTSVLQKLFFANGIEIEEKMRKRVNLRLSNLDNLNDGDLDISLSMKF